MHKKEYKNDNSDDVLKRIIDKIVEYDESFRKIKSYLEKVNLFIKEDPFVRDFKFLNEEMLKVEKSWKLPVEIRINKNERKLFHKITYFLKNIYFKILFFLLKPFRNRLIANNLAFMNALKYLVDSHKKLISDIDNLSKKNVEILTEINRSIVGISEQQDYILKKLADSKKKVKDKDIVNE